MKLFPNLRKALLMATVLTAAAACSSGPVVQDYPVTANATEEVTNLENNVKTAQANQVDVLSPKNFQEANEALMDAKKMQSKGKDTDKVLHEIAVGNAYLANANAVADVARSNIEDVIAARQAAVTAGAPSYFGKEMKKADEDFKDVTKDIEKNKLSSATKERADLQKKYLELELKAIKEKNLGESRNTISLAKKEKAEKFAPRTLAIAEKSYTDTEAYITANRHNTIAIEARAAETKQAAMHALNINRTAKGTNKTSSEETALAMEKERQRVAAKESQLSSVKGELDATQNALEGSVDTNVALMSAQQKLEAEQKKLEAEKAFNEKYEAARKEFASNEAEVYKQGDALLIRLKGMEFPSAKATIQPKNKELLSKVQKVMEDFGASNVIVEGHTDSVGGKQVNDRLSQNRAEAVKNYLQTNGGGMSEESSKIEAVGYGYQKPLATNKTASGRAQNRRVDIIIKPEGAPASETTRQ
ncbi:OmpA family protein [Bacteriovorax sp. PP10]|uniref:OmpA family protein n=1 Tax=Bacteriovorax antarcticus TaxID=3088717 RepID=A0ABU5VZC1_9BACT|nr:OmpA family protein [Bacteriovorax sp. PP10]MEA9357674.1 OmpA family protein [Bacteriovorax sp. PP10]